MQLLRHCLPPLLAICTLESLSALVHVCKNLSLDPARDSLGVQATSSKHRFMRPARAMPLLTSEA